MSKGDLERLAKTPEGSRLLETLYGLSVKDVRRVNDAVASTLRLQYLPRDAREDAALLLAQLVGDVVLPFLLVQNDSIKSKHLSDSLSHRKLNEALHRIAKGESVKDVKLDYYTDERGVVSAGGLASGHKDFYAKLHSHAARHLGVTGKAGTKSAFCELIEKYKASPYFVRAENDTSGS